MPECNNCGNDRWFEHGVEGTQVREYDETGELRGVEEDRLETTSIACDECGSSDVEQ